MGEYRLIEGPPALADYLSLRLRAGLSPKDALQGEAALRGSWWAAHVVAADGVTVGMGRIIGDGGWYFHIVDMAVLPEHQRRGIGDVILTSLVDRIRREAPAEPYITLLADEPGRRLYARHGFVPTAPQSVGMKLSKQLTAGVGLAGSRSP
jgi:GNAT superfamily N-acetyltransferase